MLRAGCRLDAVPFDCIKRPNLQQSRAAAQECAQMVLAPLGPTASGGYFWLMCNA